MTAFTEHRIRHGNWGRTVLSAILIAWLSTALQPCLMAMEMSPEPAAGMAHSMADHVGHAAGETSTVHPCAHCPSADTQSNDTCASEIRADCGQSPNYYDTRTIKVKDAPADAPVAIAAPVYVIPRESISSASSGRGDKSYLPGTQPSLHVLYGVYLI